MIRNRQIVLIIQARMGSKRLPGKVLRAIGNKPMLQMVIDRVSRSNLVDQIVVATTTAHNDDKIAGLCSVLGVPVVRGSELDVLGRFYQASREFPAEIYVRVTADCPLLDPEIVDMVIGEFDRNGVQYAANRMPGSRSYPIGLDVEVFDSRTLEIAHDGAILEYQREHVTPFMYDGSASISLLHVKNSEGDWGDERWTVDTAEDLEFIQHVVSCLDEDDTGWKHVLAVLETYPDWRRINQHISQRYFTVTDSE